MRSGSRAESLRRREGEGVGFGRGERVGRGCRSTHVAPWRRSAGGVLAVHACTGRLGVLAATVVVIVVAVVFASEGQAKHGYANSSARCTELRYASQLRCFSSPAMHGTCVCARVVPVRPARHSAAPSDRGRYSNIHAALPHTQRDRGEDVGERDASLLQLCAFSAYSKRPSTTQERQRREVMNVGSSLSLRIVGPTQQRCSLLLLQLWASPRCCYQDGIKKR